jgi:hypothetical protein
MEIPAFLLSYAEHSSRRLTAASMLGVRLPEAELPVLHLLWKIACVHLWEQRRTFRALTGADPNRDEALCRMREHAECCAAMLALALDEADPYLAEPADSDAPLPAVSESLVWLRHGLSSLCVELVMGVVARTGPYATLAVSEFAWLTEGFRLERSCALAEAGRHAKRTPDGVEGLIQALEKFVPAPERFWGEPFMIEALDLLKDRFDKLCARECADGLRAVPELAEVSLWRVVEPHLGRYQDVLEIGRMKRLAIRAALTFL